MSVYQSNLGCFLWAKNGCDHHNHSGKILRKVKCFLKGMTFGSKDHFTQEKKCSKNAKRKSFFMIYCQWVLARENE